MIVADTRGRLDQSDLQLVLLLLARGSASARVRWEKRLAREGPAPLLDAPELAERLLAVRTLLAPSEALFLYVMVRHALRVEGVDDADLADYLAALLLAFVDVMKELPATLVLRPFNFDTLATQTYLFAKDERLAEAALPSLAIVAVGLVPIIALSRIGGRRRAS